MNDQKHIQDIMNAYWSTQATGFTEISIYELNGEPYHIWESILRRNFDPAKCQHFVDVGCGAGFFGIMLSKMGQSVLEIDQNEAMLQEAERNIAAFGVRENVSFLRANAQALPLEDESADFVISRNVMWSLPEPEKAYRDWLRILKPGGIILNFDSNWFLHRFDAEAALAYEKGQALIRESGEELKSSDHTPEVDDAINQLPLTHLQRPAWDIEVLSPWCKRVDVVEALPDELYDDYYQLQYRYIPTFFIKAEK